MQLSGLVWHRSKASLVQWFLLGALWGKPLSELQRAGNGCRARVWLANLVVAS